MLTKSLYRVSDGKVLSVISGQVGFVEFPDVAGCDYVDGAACSKTEFVLDGVITKLPDDVLSTNETNTLWKLFRNIRDSRLAATDWTQVPDAPVNQQAWATYRQALRDLPENTTDPENPDWPVPPSN